MEQEESVSKRLGKVENKLTKLEVITEKQEEMISQLSESNRVQIELNTLLKLQIEANKDQQKQIQEQHNTLVKMNENLSGLNTGLQDLNHRVTIIENQDSKKKLDLVELAKDIIFKVVPTLIGAWLLFKFGLK